MNLDRLTFPIVQISLDLTSLDEALETAAIAVDEKNGLPVKKPRMAPS